MSAPVNLRLPHLLFYGLLALATYSGLSRGGLELTAIASDKVLHWAGYTGLLVFGRVAHGRRPVAVFSGLFLYSIGIEIIQYFLPYRSFEVLDILANLTGLVTGSLLWWLFRRLYPRRPAGGGLS